jgi:hypothetical protein
MKVYFGFAISDGMFDGDCVAIRSPLSVDHVREVIHGGVIPCLNPSHKATIVAMQEKFGIDVEIPATPPSVKLSVGDALVIMSVRGLPRLTDRHEYTSDEIDRASFSFALWQVKDSQCLCADCR